MGIACQIVRDSPAQRDVKELDARLINGTPEGGFFDGKIPSVDGEGYFSYLEGNTLFRVYTEEDVDSFVEKLPLLNDILTDPLELEGTHRMFDKDDNLTSYPIASQSAPKGRDATIAEIDGYMGGIGYLKVHGNIYSNGNTTARIPFEGAAYVDKNNKVRLYDAQIDSKGQGYKGRIVRVDDSDGNESKLYKTVLKTVKDSEKALKLWAVSYTQKFKDWYGRSVEPSAADLFTYIRKQFHGFKEVTEQDVEELRDAMAGTGGGNTSDFYNTLVSNLLEEGRFKLTREGLKATGYYNEFEIDRILRNPAVADKLEAFLTAMEVSRANGSFKDFDVPQSDPHFTITDNTEVNALGKSKTYEDNNLKNSVLLIVAGITDREIFDGLMASERIESSFRERYATDPDFADSFFNRASNLVKVPRAVVVGGGLIAENSGVTEQTLNEVLLIDGPDLTEVSALLDTLNEEDFAASKDLKAMFGYIEDALVARNIDAVGFADKAMDKSIGEVRAFVRQSQDFTRQTATGNADVRTYVQALNEFMGNTVAPQYDFVHKSEFPVEMGVKVTGNLSTVDAFANHGLIATEGGYHAKVDNTHTFDALIQHVNQAAVGGATILPDKYYRPEAANRDGSISPAKLKQLAQNGTLQDVLIKNIQAEVSNMEGDTDVLVRMQLTRLLLDIPAPTAQASKIFQIFDFKGNLDYIASDFIADAYQKYLNGKRGNTKSYRNLYSQLKFGENGITYVPQSDYAAHLAKVEAAEGHNDLKNHALVNKEGSLLELFDYRADTIPDIRRERTAYANNPSEIPPFKGAYTVSGDYIAVSGISPNFINVGGMAYEKVSDTNTAAWYAPLQTNPSATYYNPDVPKPKAYTETKAGTTPTLAPKTTLKKLYKESDVLLQEC